MHHESHVKFLIIAVFGAAAAATAVVYAFLIAV